MTLFFRRSSAPQGGGGGGGDLTHGENATISGSGFGTRSVALDIFDDASSPYSWGGAGSISTPVTPAAFGRGVDLPHSNITKYYAGNIANDGFNGQLTLGATFTIAKPAKAYVKFSHRLDPSWVFGYAGEDNNFKFFGYSADNEGFVTFGTYWYVDCGGFQKSSLTGAHNYVLFSSGGMGSLNEVEGPVGGSSAQDVDSWYGWVDTEFRFGLSSSGQTFKSLRNNSVFHDLSSLNTDDEADGARSIGPYCYANSRDPVNNNVYWADICIVTGTNAWKRVMLTDNATYATPGAIVEYQPIVSWSNTLITYRCNKGRLSAGTVHEWWFDDSDTPTYVGTRTMS